MSSAIQSLLVCPLTKQDLFPLDQGKTEFLFNALRDAELYHVDGSKLVHAVANLQFLVTENKQHVYSVIDGVPILLEAKQIDLSQLTI